MSERQLRRLINEKFKLLTFTRCGLRERKRILADIQNLRDTLEATHALRQATEREKSAAS